MRKADAPRRRQQRARVRRVAPAAARLAAPSAPTSAPNPELLRACREGRLAHAGARSENRGVGSTGLLRVPGQPGGRAALRARARASGEGIIIGYILGARDRRVADDQKRRCATPLIFSDVFFHRDGRRTFALPHSS